MKDITSRTRKKEQDRKKFKNLDEILKFSETKEKMKKYLIELSQEDRFDQLFQRFGYRITFNPAMDGRCQFAALSQQLQEHGITDISPNDLRESTVNYLIEFRRGSSFSTRGDFVTFLDPERNSSYNDYVNQMRLNTTFGDHITLQAISELYFVRIQVVSSHGRNYDTIIVPQENGIENIPTLRIGHDIDSLHYLSVSPIVDFNIERMSDGMHSEMSGRTDREHDDDDCRMNDGIVGELSGRADREHDDDDCRMNDGVVGELSGRADREHDDDDCRMNDGVEGELSDRADREHDDDDCRMNDGVEGELSGRADREHDDDDCRMNDGVEGELSGRADREHDDDDCRMNDGVEGELSDRADREYDDDDCRMNDGVEGELSGRADREHDEENEYGIIYLHDVKEKLPKQLVISARSLMELSGSRASGISLELRDVLSNIERPMQPNGRMIRWDQAILGLTMLMHGWYAIITLRWT